MTVHELSFTCRSNWCIILVISILATLYFIDFETASLPSLTSSFHRFSNCHIDALQPKYNNTSSSVSSSSSSSYAPTVIPSMTFLTLSFGDNDSYAEKVITHNCMMFKKMKPHRFIIYTTNKHSKSFCSNGACSECIEYKYYNCTCVEDNKRRCDKRNACEKLYFVTDMLNEYEQFVLLDHDLIIVKESFAAAMAAKSVVHDFVACRAHSQLGNTDYFRFFNSGLFFIRKLLDHDPMVLREWFYHKNTVNRDQRIFSQYILNFYSNWDELSYKWNCRFLGKQNIPVQDCYTVHEGEQRVYPLLDLINFSFLHP